jgi:hypothetical protein
MAGFSNFSTSTAPMGTAQAGTNISASATINFGHS